MSEVTDLVLELPVNMRSNREIVETAELTNQKT